jgi:undecaprenyl-diphosphatase
MTDATPVPLAVRRRARAGLIAGWICAAAVLLSLAWLGRGVVLRHDFGFDRAVRSEVHDRSAPAATQARRAASLYGSPGVLTVVSVLAAGALRLRRRFHGAELVVVTILGALLLSASLKMALPRARPDPFFGVPLPRSGSFPSGHALVAMSFFGGVAAVTARRTPRRSLKIAIWGAALVATLLVGLSRIYLGVHYPSDVIAGYGVGLLWVGVVAATDRRISHRVAQAPPPLPGPSTA